MKRELYFVILSLAVFFLTLLFSVGAIVSTVDGRPISLQIFLWFMAIVFNACSYLCAKFVEAIKDEKDG